MLVSVIIPYYKSEKYIFKTVKDIKEISGGPTVALYCKTFAKIVREIILTVKKRQKLQYFRNENTFFKKYIEKIPKDSNS